MLILLLASCGFITEQNCDECWESARFANACSDYLEEEIGLAFDCYKSVDLDPDSVCTSEKFQNGECDGLGWYYFSDEDFEQLAANLENETCNSLIDWYASCKTYERNRKKGLNAIDQWEFYNGKINEEVGEYEPACRTWIGDEKSDVEKAIEKRDCEAWAEAAGFF